MERYRIRSLPDHFWFEEAEDGVWVKCSDVADLEAQLALYKRRLWNWRALPWEIKLTVLLAWLRKCATPS